MADNLVEIDLPTIQGMDEILKPSDRPVLGKQRLVRFALVEHFGNFPIVWTSPYTIMTTLKENEPAVCVAALASWTVATNARFPESWSSVLGT